MICRPLRTLYLEDDVRRIPPRPAVVQQALAGEEEAHVEMVAVAAAVVVLGEV